MIKTDIRFNNYHKRLDNAQSAAGMWTGNETWNQNFLDALAEQRLGLSSDNTFTSQSSPPYVAPIPVPDQLPTWPHDSWVIDLEQEDPAYVKPTGIPGIE